MYDETKLKRKVIAYWQESTDNRPVKVTSILRDKVDFATGYITAYKFVAGRKLDDVEQILGLKPGTLNSGAYLYEFLRLPQESEFDFRSYTHLPGGQPWTPGSDYPVGRGAAQWEIRRDAKIPTILAATFSPHEVVKL